MRAKERPCKMSENTRFHFRGALPYNSFSVGGGRLTRVK